MNKKSPTIIAVAGSPGAGRTSFVPKGLDKGVLPKAFVPDYDAVMCRLKGYQTV